MIQLETSKCEYCNAGDCKLMEYNRRLVCSGCFTELMVDKIGGAGK